MNASNIPIISFLYQKHPWVEQFLEMLSLEEKIGQLIHVAAYSNRDQTHTEYILNLIETHHIGGLTFFQGHPFKQAELTNLYQSKTKVPLMISIDGEWGLGMRLDETMSFPYQMALGALKDDTLIYEMGKEIARQCNRIGVHVNFAPVVDVNNNPNNPVIGFRSFGEDVDKIISKASAYMKGMQAHGILACAKHFPGHGDTDVDSHFDLPTIPHSKERLESTELHPFRELFALGIGSTMVAHLHIPAIDPVDGRAATLSPPIVNGLLKTEMGYKGLVFTDALDMKGVSKTDTPAKVGMKALIAGHDVLLNIQDVPGTIEEIKKALDKGEITHTEIEERCRKNLSMKLWLGLNKLSPISLEHIVEDLATPQAQILRHKLYEATVTGKGISELNLNPQLNIATVALYINTTGENLPPELQQHALEKGANETKQQNLSILQISLDNLGGITHYRIDQSTTEAQFQELLEKLSGYDKIIFSIHSIAIKARNRFGISDSSINRINRVIVLPQVITCILASAYVLDLFQWPADSKILIAYQENELTQQIAAEVLMGKREANGQLPVTTKS